MTKSGSTRQDLVSSLGPNERLRVLIATFDVSVDGVLQFARAAVDATLDLLLGQRGEEALDQVEPGGPGGREVHVEAEVAHQPAANERRLWEALGANLQPDCSRIGWSEGVNLPLPHFQILLNTLGISITQARGRGF